MSGLWEYVKHLWATTPVDVGIACPAIGGEPSGNQGFIAPAYLTAAWSLTFWLSLAIVVLLVVWCYNGTRMTTGPGFSRRWLVFVPLGALGAALVAFVVLSSMPFYVVAGSCDTNPEAFAVSLPSKFVWMRVFAGAIWGFVVFVMMSIVLTKTLGRASWNNGFFQNRGTPLPRFMPTGRNR